MAADKFFRYRILIKNIISQQIAEMVFSHHNHNSTHVPLFRNIPHHFGMRVIMENTRSQFLIFNANN